MKTLMNMRAVQLAGRILLIALFVMLAWEFRGIIGFSRPVEQSADHGRSLQIASPGGLPAGIFGRPTAGYWVFSQTACRLAVERISSADLASWLDALTAIDAFPPASADPSPVLLELLREHATQEKAVGEGRVVYHLDFPSLRIRILLSETATATRFLAARCAFPRGKSHWQGITATSASGAMPNLTACEPLAPWPAGAKQIAVRYSGDNMTLCEIRAISGRIDKWLDASALQRDEAACDSRSSHRGELSWFHGIHGWVMLRSRYDTLSDKTICLAVALDPGQNPVSQVSAFEK